MEGVRAWSKTDIVGYYIKQEASVHLCSRKGHDGKDDNRAKMAENMRTLSNSRTMSQPTRKLGHKVSSLSIQSQQTTVFVESHEAGYVTRPYRFLVQV